MNEVLTEHHDGLVIEASNMHRSVIVRDLTDRLTRAFPFDQIEGYEGQRIRGMGLLPGTVVTLKLRPDHRIRSVEFPFVDRYRRFGRFKLPFQDYVDNAFPS